MIKKNTDKKKKNTAKNHKVGRHRIELEEHCSRVGHGIHSLASPWGQPGHRSGPAGEGPERSSTKPSTLHGSFSRGRNTLCGVPWGSPGGSISKESACRSGDLSLIPGSGRSPGEENGTPLQYSRLENSMDRGAWWATVLGAAKSQTQLSNYHFHFDDASWVLTSGCIISGANSQIFDSETIVRPRIRAFVPRRKNRATQ